MRNAYTGWLTFFIFISGSPVAMSGSPQPDGLLIRYYQDTGADLRTGQAVVLRHTYQPVFSPDRFTPPNADPKDDALNLKRYHRYLSEVYDVKLGSGSPVEKWTLERVYYSGTKKRLDQAVLKAAEYESVLAGKSSIKDFPVAKCWDDGRKMTSLNDEGGMKHSPEGTVMNFQLGLPDFQHYGRARCSLAASEYIVKALKSDRFVITGADTSGGYLVTATATKGSTSRIEALFDAKNDFRVKRISSWDRGVLMEEELFDNYTKTGSGHYVPTKVVRRKFAPIFETMKDAKTGREFAKPGKDGVVKPLVSFEETVTVLSVDFNVDIPESILTPAFPNGTRVYDGTVTPPRNYIVGGEKKRP